MVLRHKYVLKKNIKKLITDIILLLCILVLVGRDSSVGIATRYGLDGQGIESQWGVRFSAPLPDRPWGPHSFLYNGCRVFPGGKAAGAWL